MDDRAHAVKPVEVSSGRVGSAAPSRFGSRIRLIWIHLAGASRAGLAGVVLDRALAKRQQHGGRERGLGQTGLARAEGAAARRAGDDRSVSRFWGRVSRSSATFENLPQRGPIVLTALLIAAAAVGLGDLVMRGLGLERGLGLGAAGGAWLRPGSGTARHAAR